MPRSTWIVVIGAVVALLAAAGFVLFQSSRSISPSPVAQSTPAASQPPGSVEGAREIVVEAKEFSFTPAEIVLKSGETVKLTFKNSGKFPHNFTLDDLGVGSKTLQPGETDTVEFTANKTGTFKFYCSVANHKALGMQGEVEVK